MIERVKLSEVCRIVGGSTPDSMNRSFWNGDIVWITPTDLGKLDTIEITASERTITEAGYKSCSTELVPVGSVILSTRAPIGHLGVVGVPLCTNQGCKGVVPGPKVDSIFLYFQLLSSVEKLKKLGSGATFTELPKSKLESFEIALPPLEEQKLIASRLFQQFAAIDRARAAAEERLKAAEMLQRAYLREVFESAESEKWEQMQFEDVAYLQRGHDLPAVQQIQGPYPVITSSGMMGTHNKFRYKGPGVITGRSGSLGKVYYVETDYWPHNTALFVKDFKGNFPKLIYYILQWMSVHSVGSGSGVPTLDRKQVHKLMVRRPSFQDQVKLASYLDKCFNQVELLQRSLEEQLAELYSLPTVLLRKAFELTE